MINVIEELIIRRVITNVYSVMKPVINIRIINAPTDVPVDICIL